MIDKRRNLPATVEFGMRCAMVQRQRWRRKDSGQTAIAKPHMLASPIPQVSSQEIRELLDRLEIKAGDTVMVHSSAAAIEQLGWAPSDFLDLLQEHLGRQGTLAMPTHPKLKLQDGKRLYNVRRSPSQVGLLTELFRRRAGVIRSAFPFSAAAACGPNAKHLLAEHGDSFAPHDEKSPYAKLLEVNGKCLCIGCPLDRMTILHVAEDAYREELGIAGFHQPEPVKVKDATATREVIAHTRAPWLWWYLHLFGWTSRMYRSGLAWDERLSGVDWRRADARPTIEWMQTELRNGRSIYPLAWLNRWLRLSEPQLELQS